MKLRKLGRVGQALTFDMTAPLHKWQVTFRIEERDVRRLLALPWLPVDVYVRTDVPAAGPEAEISIVVRMQKADRAEEYVRRQLARAAIPCLAIKSGRA